MQVKKHLSGGTLRAVMVAEIKRCLASHSGDEGHRVERAAMELGIAPRTLRVWVGPEAQGGWPELQVKGAMEKLLAVKPKKAKKARKKSKKSSQAAEVRA